jgi:hypothetical protein
VTDYLVCAAAVAALAGAGKGRDADTLDSAARAEWRRRALAWTRADLAARRERSSAAEWEAHLRDVLRDSDWAGVREEAELAKLPAEERAAWRELWGEVREALDEVKGEEPR